MGVIGGETTPMFILGIITGIIGIVLTIQFTLQC